MSSVGTWKQKPTTLTQQTQKGLIMSKTPYEIRLELLSMAQNILSENMYAERNRLENDWQFLREIAIEGIRSGNQFAQAVPYPTLPTISSDEIIALATKLNEFVSNKE